MDIERVSGWLWLFACYQQHNTTDTKAFAGGNRRSVVECAISFSLRSHSRPTTRRRGWMDACLLHSCFLPLCLLHNQRTTRESNDRESRVYRSQSVSHKLFPEGNNKLLRDHFAHSRRIAVSNIVYTLYWSEVVCWDNKRCDANCASVTHLNSSKKINQKTLRRWWMRSNKSLTYCRGIDKVIPIYFSSDNGQWCLFGGAKYGS